MPESFSYSIPYLKFNVSGLTEKGNLCMIRLRALKFPIAGLLLLIGAEGESRSVVGTEE